MMVYAKRAATKPAPPNCPPKAVASGGHVPVSVAGTRATFEHRVRGAFAGALKKRRADGHVREIEGRGRVYRIND